MLMRTGACRSAWCHLLYAVCAATDPSAGDAGSPDSPPVVEYAPHVRIDWTRTRVEVDGQVVLREGMLELLMCSPNTREHESIIVSSARPLRIYEALGLVGLTPGHPVRYDEKRQEWIAPAGDAVRIEVRWKVDGDRKQVDVGTWMRDVRTGEPVPAGAWVFAGSYRTDDGSFATDQDGTLICVVDFPTALIALPELHSADNALLTFQANTDAIPPIDTPVTLLFSPAGPVPVVVLIRADGKLMLAGQTISLDALRDRMKTMAKGGDMSGVVLHAEGGADKAVVERVVTAIREAAGPKTSVRVLVGGQQPKVDRAANERDSEQP